MLDRNWHSIALHAAHCMPKFAEKLWAQAPAGFIFAYRVKQSDVMVGRNDLDHARTQADLMGPPLHLMYYLGGLGAFPTHPSIVSSRWVAQNEL